MSVRWSAKGVMTNATMTRMKAFLSAVLGVLASWVARLRGRSGCPARVSARDVNQSDGQIRGRGLALVGIGLGTLGTFACVLFSVAFALLHVREAGAKKTCENNLRRMGRFSTSITIFMATFRTGPYSPGASSPAAMLELAVQLACFPRPESSRGVQGSLALG